MNGNVALCQRTFRLFLSLSLLFFFFSLSLTLSPASFAHIWQQEKIKGNSQRATVLHEREYASVGQFLTTLALILVVLVRVRSERASIR